MSNYCVVMTTVGNNEEARRIIDYILECKLAACLQTISIGSHYTWGEKVCHEQEILILFKSSWALYNDLERKIKEIHPYDTPEIIAFDIEKGFNGYLNWIDEVIKKM